MAHRAAMLSSCRLPSHPRAFAPALSSYECGNHLYCCSSSRIRSKTCLNFRRGKEFVFNRRRCRLGRKAEDHFVLASSPRETVDFTLAEEGREEEEEEEVGPSVVPAPPPSTGRIDIVVDKNALRSLDLSAAHAVLRKFVHDIGDNKAAPSTDPRELFERTVGFVLKYERDDPLDPRELSEMPDIRLWFVRLDAAYPWLPIVLDWRAGELARYAAMLVPHQMSKKSGLVFNPEALELFAMSKVFVLHPWLRARGISKPTTKLNDMLRMLGFSVSDQLYGLVEQHPPPP